MSTEAKHESIAKRAASLVADATKRLEQNDFPGVWLEVWTVKSRAILTAVYGKDSPQERALPHPGVDSHLPMADRVRARLPLLASLSSGLAEVGPKTKIFIGHGGKSLEWLKLKDFLSHTLKLSVDEFNLKPMAGLQTTDRLQQMRMEAGLAFLVLTGEDELSDGKVQARPNVIHEVGLFQAQLGWHRAIVMLEDGCASFSNLDGLTRIAFPRDNIEAGYEEVRGVLSREGFLPR